MTHSLGVDSSQVESIEASNYIEFDEAEILVLIRLLDGMLIVDR